MSKSATWPPASRGERPLPDTVRTVLIESERRVLSHCQEDKAEASFKNGVLTISLPKSEKPGEGVRRIAINKH